MSRINIAMDGPSGAGKSSIADELAKRLGMIHLDTGAMYRALSWYLDELGISPEEPERIREALKDFHLDMIDNQVFVNGENPGKRIRTERISELTSLFSAIPVIRDAMVLRQQQITADGGYIVDGRDICDVVLPDAQIKIYLDASDTERARRRWIQLEQAGTPESYEKVLEKIRQRDHNDQTRELSPLRRSKDAIYIDSSDMDFEQSVQAILDIAQEVIQGVEA